MSIDAGRNMRMKWRPDEVSMKMKQAGREFNERKMQGRRPRMGGGGLGGDECYDAAAAVG